MATTEQQQLDFGPDREADRAERLRRILSIDPRIQTADHAFTEQAQQEAERRCREALGRQGTGAGSASTR